MNKTGIEWTLNPDGSPGYTCNSKTGCKNCTPEGLCLGGMFPCYAHRLTHGRLSSRYLANKIGLRSDLFRFSDADPNSAKRQETVRAVHDPFYPRWWPERLEQIRKHKQPAGIFLDDMSDWMGDYWPEEWTRQELQVMRDCPQHRFYTLTKQPQNLPKWSPFPDNCWVGVTATNQEQYYDGVSNIVKVEAKVKFVSFEPLLEQINGGECAEEYRLDSIDEFDWLIIGACTGTEEEMEKLQNKYQSLSVMPYGMKWAAQPPREWVQEIVEAVDHAGIRVFLKDNLEPLLRASYKTFGELNTKLVRAIKYPSWEWELRQEMPRED